MLSLFDDWPPDYKEQFWSRYPPGRRKDKIDAMKALEKVHKLGVPWATFIAGVERYAFEEQNTEPRYIKLPATWLNKGGWHFEDQPNGKRPGPNRADPPSRPAATHADAIMAGMARVKEKRLGGEFPARSGNGPVSRRDDAAPASAAVSGAKDGDPGTHPCIDLTPDPDTGEWR